MANKVNDFGFFFDDDLSETVATVTSDKITTENAAKALYAKIDMLLKNLESNPDKPTINWPDRVSHVQKFRASLQKILTDAGISV